MNVSSRQDGVEVFEGAEMVDVSRLALCVSFCEIAHPKSSADDLADLLVRACWESGFPHVERLYAGSYFCENYFLGLSDTFHESMRQLVRAHDMKATLVVPILGQAFAERAESRLIDVLDRFGDVYDEVVVNDVALFSYLTEVRNVRVGIGRLFSKEPRDARYADMMERSARPTLSAEAKACIAQSADFRPLLEVDPVSAVLDLSAVRAETPDAEIAIHLPYCFATTGRNCGPASVDEPDDEKFRIGRRCSQHCLRMAQGYRTGEGATYVKHGRTYYFRNPACAVVGAESWRIVYAAPSESMEV